MATVTLSSAQGGLASKMDPDALPASLYLPVWRPWLALYNARVRVSHRVHEVRDVPRQAAMVCQACCIAHAAPSVAMMPPAPSSARMRLCSSQQAAFHEPLCRFSLLQRSTRPQAWQLHGREGQDLMLH